MTDISLVRINCPDAEIAERIAEAAVSDRLAACANVQGPFISIYEWKGSLERTEEWLLWLKTSKALFKKLEDCIVFLHPYEVPAILLIDCADAHDPFAAWINEAVSVAGKGMSG